MNKPHRVPGELVAYVQEKLSAAGHPNPSEWTKRLHPDALTTTDASVERFLVNRALRTEIGLYEEQTTEVRYCLVDDGVEADWRRLIADMVVPCMVRNA